MANIGAIQQSNVDKPLGQTVSWTFTPRTRPIGTAYSTSKAESATINYSQTVVQRGSVDMTGQLPSGGSTNTVKQYWG